MPIGIPKDSPGKPTRKESSEFDPEGSDERSPSKSKAMSEEKVAASISKEAEDLQTAEDCGLVEPETDESASAEITKQMGGGYLDSTRDPMKFSPGGPKDPLPRGNSQLKNLSEKATDKSRPTDDVESSQVGGENLTDSVYRRMFFLRHFQFDDIILHVNGQIVLIDAKHGDYADEHGFVSRTFVRVHQLPEHVIANKLTSYFTGDGVLVIEAPCSQIQPRQSA